MALNSAQLIGTGLLDGFRNRIMNAGMLMDQWNNGSALTLSSTTIGFGLDRWQTSNTTDGTITVGRSNDAPAGFSNSQVITVTGTDATMGASQYLTTFQTIEGNNTIDLGWGTANAQTVSLSFWVKSSLTGTFSGAIRNAGPTYGRSYPFTYTINAANTWEKKFITIPGSTSGTWAVGLDGGIDVLFTLGVGSTFANTAGAWANGNFIGTTSGVNLMATNGATWYLSGVQFERGPVATDFEYLASATYIAHCQRYFVRWRGSAGATGYVGIGSGIITSTTAASILIPVPASMRTTPVLSYSGTVTCSDGAAAGNINGITSTYTAGPGNIWCAISTAAGTWVQGNGALLYTQNASTNFFTANAEFV